jgi:hypothetical protein
VARAAFFFVFFLQNKYSNRFIAMGAAREACLGNTNWCAGCNQACCGCRAATQSLAVVRSAGLRLGHVAAIARQQG